MGSQWLAQEVLLYATVPNRTYEIELERDGRVGESEIWETGNERLRSREPRE